MYYYIKSTRSKVVHLSDCRHVHNLEIDRLVAFENVVQAEESATFTEIGCNYN